METFLVQIEIGTPDGEHFEPVQALVGAGVKHTLVSQRLLAGLEVRRVHRAPFILAGGAEVERPLGMAWVQVGERRVFTYVMFGGETEQALLGSETLEELRLTPDPASKSLIPVEDSQE